MSTLNNKVLPAFRNAQLAISSKKKQGYTMMMKPSIWKHGRGKIPDILFVTILDVSNGLDRPHQPLGLLTRTKLPKFPQFPLYLRSSDPTLVVSHSLETNLEVSRAEISELTSFTFRAMLDIWNKGFENDDTKMPYWIAPLNLVPGQAFSNSTLLQPRTIVDWTTLQMVANNAEIPWTAEMSCESLKDRFLVDRFSGGRRFFSVEVVPNLKPLDPVPDDAVKVEKWSDCILSYTNRLWTRTRDERQSKWDMDQPVLLVEQMLHRQNLLDNPTEKERAKTTKAYVCPQPLKFSAVRRLYPTLLFMLTAPALDANCYNVYGISTDRTSNRVLFDRT